VSVLIINLLQQEEMWVARLFWRIPAC